METRAKESFFERDTPHGLVKRTMYKKYVQAFIAKTQNKGLYTILIDGFSGCGRYSNEWPSEMEKYGSPLIATMATLDFQSKGHERRHDPIFGWDTPRQNPEEELMQMKNCMKDDFATPTAKVLIILVEKKKKNYKRLVTNLRLLLAKFLHYQFPDLFYNFKDFTDTRGAHTTMISLVMKPFSFAIKVVNMQFSSFDAPAEIHRNYTRSLTFVDPFGFSQIPMEHIKKFVPGEGNELFITLMSQAINRFMGVHPLAVCELYGIQPPDEEELGEFIKYVILGSDTEQKGEKMPSTNKIKKCTYTYEHYLRRSTKSTFLQSFEVRDKSNIILYHMIHTTNHIKGVEAMKESMNRCSQEKGEMAMSDYTVLKLGKQLNFGNLDDEDEIANAIFEEFHGGQQILVEPRPGECNDKDRILKCYQEIPPKYQTIFDFILLGTKYVFRKKPLKKLQKQQKIIKVVNGDEQTPKKVGTFPETDQWYVSFAEKPAPETDQSVTAEGAVSEKLEKMPYSETFAPGEITKPDSRSSKSAPKITSEKQVGSCIEKKKRKSMENGSGDK